MMSALCFGIGEATVSSEPSRLDPPPHEIPNKTSVLPYPYIPAGGMVFPNPIARYIYHISSALDFKHSKLYVISVPSDQRSTIHVAVGQVRITMLEQSCTQKSRCYFSRDNTSSGAQSSLSFHEVRGFVKHLTRSKGTRELLQRWKNTRVGFPHRDSFI